MAAVERLIPGTFSRVAGGYERKIDKTTRLFVPDICASRFSKETGELYGISPDYEKMEAEKAAARVADAPGEYLYYYENEKAPIGCDFSSDLAYDGDHYLLKPLRDGLPRLKGRGITYDERWKAYIVTERAYGKICKEYKVKREMCFD